MPYAWVGEAANLPEAGAGFSFASVRFRKEIAAPRKAATRITVGQTPMQKSCGSVTFPSAPTLRKPSRQGARESLALVVRLSLTPRVEEYPLAAANDVVCRPKAGGVRAAAVLRVSGEAPGPTPPRS